MKLPKWPCSLSRLTAFRYIALLINTILAFPNENWAVVPVSSLQPQSATLLFIAVQVALPP